MDFFQYYAPSHMWLTGGDPYDRVAYTAHAAALFPEHHIESEACPLLPSGLTIFAPLTWLAPGTAAHLMWILSFTALILSATAMRRWARGWRVEEQLLVLAVLVQSRLIQSVAYRGQPSLLMLAAVLLAFAANRRGAPLLAGTAAALATA